MKDQPWLQWRRRRGSPLPAFADEIVQLALFATGDQQAALGLARVALHRAPNLGAAVTALDRLLPHSWHDWPTVGPREALLLDLPAHATERLLSILGSWSPRERLLIGLYLELNIPREQLGRWLRFSDANNRVIALLSHVARSIYADPYAPKHTICRALGDTLLDAADPELGRPARLHLLGCPNCQAHTTALQRSTKLLQLTLETVFPRQPFRGPTRPRLPHLRRWQWEVGWRATLVLLMLAVGFKLSRSPAEPRTTLGTLPGLTTADAVLRYALERWDLPGRTGVSHERYRTLSGDRPLIVERWYEWSPPHRLRVIVRDSNDALLLDVITDGTRQLSYTLAQPNSPLNTITVLDPGVATLQPLLRQLPTQSPFNNLQLDAQHFDHYLLWLAQAHQPRLLGSSIVHERRALRVAVRLPDQTNIHLLIDQATGALLQATRITPDNRSFQTVWEIEQIEHLRSAGQSLQLPSGPVLAALPSPRILTGPAELANTSLALLARHGPPLVLPDRLPALPLIAYLHQSSSPGDPLTLVAEGERWSLLLTSYPVIKRWSNAAVLDQQSGAVRYTASNLFLPDTNTLHWEIALSLPDSQFNHRAEIPDLRQAQPSEWRLGGVISLWQPNTSRAERLAALHDVLGQLAVYDPAKPAPWFAQIAALPTAAVPTPTPLIGPVHYLP